MGDVEEPQFISLSARIAALNQQHVANAKPPQSTRPLVESRSKSINNPSISSIGSSVTKQSNNEPIGMKKVLPPPITKYTPVEQTRPPLPSRSPLINSVNGAPKPPPALPPRIPSKDSQQQLVRRESNESLASMTSNVSSISTLSLRSPSIPGRRPSSDAGRLRGLPPPLAEANLPPLPPSRRELQERELQAKSERQSVLRSNGRGSDSSPPLVSPRPLPVVVKSMPQIPTIKTTPPSLPPRMTTGKPSIPGRPTTSSNHLEGNPAPVLPPRPKTANAPVSKPLPQVQNVRKLPPQFPQRSALSWGMNKPTPNPETQPTSLPTPNSECDSPPPIPRSSRPTDSEIERLLEGPPTPPNNGCMKCRDFSAPDSVAAQYPRESFPNLTTQYLAEVLCRPFPSHTDKARAIFTWLHHNIAYDTSAFFGNNVQYATPESTLASGLAVCGGYAGLFTVIATKAGLESILVSGHGKGYGYSALKPGEKIPPYSAGHAWNAVRIDGGQWKLIDPCWGAGNVSGDSQTYNKEFNASNFTKSNEDFGLTHFPSEDSYFFRSDGKIPSWEEYYLGPGQPGIQKLQVYGEPHKDHGIDGESFLPKYKMIDVSHSEPGSRTRFQFSKVCEHWDYERNGPGKPYLMGIFINGIDGRGFQRGTVKTEFVELESNDFFHWVDIDTRSLGTAGQKAQLAAVTTVGGKDARGLTEREYKTSKGVYPMGLIFVAEWELV